MKNWSNITPNIKKKVIHNEKTSHKITGRYACRFRSDHRSRLYRSWFEQQLFRYSDNCNRNDFCLNRRTSDHRFRLCDDSNAGFRHHRKCSVFREHIRHRNHLGKHHHGCCFGQQRPAGNRFQPVRCAELHRTDRQRQSAQGREQDLHFQPVRRRL